MFFEYSYKCCYFCNHFTRSQFAGKKLSSNTIVKDFKRTKSGNFFDEEIKNVKSGVKSIKDENLVNILIIMIFSDDK